MKPVSFGQARLRSARRPYLLFTLATFAAGCSSGSAVTATSSASSVSAPGATLSEDEWRTAMSKTPLPRDGCFQATPPSMTWEEVPCIAARASEPPSTTDAVTKGPIAEGTVRPDTVGGGGTDESSQVQGLISWAQGSFPIVNGASGDSYSLQLNTNRWSGPLCAGNCYWQQFTYDSVTSQADIQYWLVGATSCPGSGGWTYFGPTSSSPGGCYIIGATMSIPGQSIANLPNLSLTGATAGGSDTITMWTGSGRPLYSASHPSALNLGQNWKAAEFNVVGSENSTVAFNPGAWLVVQTLTNSVMPTLAAPTCEQETFTAESNNLTVVPNSCCAVGGASPGIWFTESNISGATAEPCPDSTGLVPGGALAASNQFGLPNNTDLFSIDEGGALTVTWAAPGAWSYPVRLTRPQFFPQGAPLAASQQFGLTQTDVFAVDIHGYLDVTWTGESSWQGPMRIGTSLFQKGTHIATAQQVGLTQTDVFAVDTNGALTVTWVGGDGSWNSAEITAQGLFPVGAPLAASQQFGLTQTDVFLVGINGQLQVVWVDGGGAWHGPAVVGSGGQFPPGAYVAASNQFGLPINTDVFAIDASGDLNVAWVNGGNPFQGPAVLTTGSQYPAGGPLAATQQFGVDQTGQTDVFLTTRLGFLNVMWVEGGNSWQGPAFVGEAGPNFVPGSNIATSQQFGIPPQTDVFIIDGNGRRTVSWAEQANPFSGPSEIP
jgi:hypothetical protein